MRKPKTSIAIVLLFILLIFLTHIETAETEKGTSSSLSGSEDPKTKDTGVGESQKVVQNIYTEIKKEALPKPKVEVKKIIEKPQIQNQEIQTGGVVEYDKTADLSDHKKDLIAVGFGSSLSSYIVQKCNDLAPDPGECIIAAWFMGYAESTAWKTAHKNNVWGIRRGSFISQEAAFDRWMVTYLKKWYKWIHPKYYYSPKPGLPKTRYCTDEVQPDGSILPYCPHWFKNAMYAYKTLTD